MAAGPRGLPLPYPMELTSFPGSSGSSSALPTRNISPRPGTERNDGSSNIVTQRPVEHGLPPYDGGEAGVAGYDPNLPTNENLDQCLERHHITGIAFAGTIGIGILIFSGRILGLAGGLGAILSFLVAGGVVSSVMVCLAEMVSVRPVVGAIFDYPKLYIDPALGFAAGIAYWIAYTTSCVTLIVSGALICPGSSDAGKLAGWLCIPLFSIALINLFGGVKLYANAEWCFKWLKLLFVVGLDITMIVLNVIGTHSSNGSIGFNLLKNNLFPTGFRPDGGVSPPEIPGPVGIFLSIWTGITLAVYAFLGVEIVVVTAGEARYPKRDLPRASRRMYLWTIGFYVVSTFLVALNVELTDPGLLPLNSNGVGSSFSPFVVAINNASLSSTQSTALTSAATVGLVLAAWTTANTALYAGSRTLYALFCESTTPSLRRTIGATSSGGTPLWAIGATLFPSLLSFVAIAKKNGELEGLLVLDTFSAIAVTSILCVYIAQCLAFIRFKSIASSDSLNRKSPDYKKLYYRAPRQPFWAYFGLISCSLLLIFNGWHVIYKINRGSINPGDATAGLIGAYGGVSSQPIFLEGSSFC
ncbi:hypothetical protein MMC30_003794 [Trapelia coarctata]|nr:hypothetical protein [Trapelia coarctata]